MTARALTILALLTGCMPVGGLVPKHDSGLDPAGVLVFEPESLDFGELASGEAALGELALRNAGDAALELGELSVEGDTFVLVTDPALPAPIAAGAAVTLTVAYEPANEGMHGGVIIATSIDGQIATAVLTGTGTAPTEVTDELSLDNPPVDLIIATDQSGSMQDDNATLAALYLVFIQALEEVTDDWRIIVTNDDDGCSESGMITPDDPDAQAIFARDITSGGGVYTESLLTVIAHAVANVDSGECNEGFLRDDALLHAIVASDEPEQSSEPWTMLVPELQAAKDDPQAARISAVAGDYPAGCGTAQAGSGYYEAVEATQGAFLSICDNWRDNVEALAEASAWIWRVPLSATPDPDTIVVTVAGAERDEGWSYDATDNAVVFETEYPKSYQSVSVTYMTGTGS